MRVFLALLPVLAVPLSAAAAAQPGTGERLAAAIACIRNQEENIQSISMAFSYKGVTKLDLGEKELTPMVAERAFRYMASGEKQRLEREGRSGRGKADLVEQIIDTYNGEKYFHHKPREKTGSFSSKSEFPTSYFDRVYPAPRLADLLAEHADTIVAKDVVVNGEKLLSLDWTIDETHERMKMLLNPAAGYQPRRFSSRTADPSGESCLIEVEVLKYLQEGDYWFPADVVRKDTLAWKGKVTVDAETRFKLTEIQPNAPISPDAFEIDFPHGTQVLNGDLGMVTVVGRPGIQRRVLSGEEHLEMQTKGRRSASSTVLWTVVAASSVFIVLVGVFIMWRRNRTPS